MAPGVPDGDVAEGLWEGVAEGDEVEIVSWLQHHVHLTRLCNKSSLFWDVKDFKFGPVSLLERIIQGYTSAIVHPIPQNWEIIGYRSF
jgi:hypothetical protein